jgi:hypothetical protein
MLCHASYATDESQMGLFDANQANAQFYAERRAGQDKCANITESNVLYRLGGCAA